MEGVGDVCERSDLTISEMSCLYGVSLRALRFYEQTGLLAPRRVGLQRFYSARDRTRVETILTGRRLGFTLREIDRLLQTFQTQNQVEASGLVDALDAKQIQQQITSLQRQKADIEAAIGELKATLMNSEQS